MKFKNTGLIIFSSLLLAFSLSSCDKQEIIVDNKDEEIIQENTENVTNIEENVAENQNKPNEIESENDKVQSEVKYINKLTGLETTEFLSNQRPVAIMFNNLHAALPQVGISQVDVLYEITVEGAITRLMGVATDWATLPTIGSVRSSRDYFIDVSDAHNAIYVHAGGSDIAYNILWTRGTDRIDGTNGNYSSSVAFYRDPERLKKMSSEHTLVTNGERLAEAISKNKFSTKYKEGFRAPFNFSDTEFDFDGENADYVYIPFSYYAQCYLDYDKDTKLYMKGQYLNSKSSLDKHNSPHIDGNTGEQLAFTNVLVMLAPHSNVKGDTAGRISVDFTGSGNGYYISHGKCKQIIWKKATRTSGYTLYETDGKTELVMNPGKTYAAIAPTSANITIK